MKTDDLVMKLWQEGFKPEKAFVASRMGEPVVAIFVSEEIKDEVRLTSLPKGWELQDAEGGLLVYWPQHDWEKHYGKEEWFHQRSNAANTGE